jgi:aminoglycoside phosphotransferase family enzyme/predicted kinase
MESSELLAFLSDPASYPDPTRNVRREETHISWVFLTDDFAYKVKKPVRYDFLDYSTLELREKACQREVRLNRRLAPQVYLGVVPIGAGPSGLTFHPDGPALEYAVRMRRLPADRMLDHLVRTGQATAADLERVLDVLLPFYAAAAADPRVSRHATPAAWRKNVRGNLKALRELEGFSAPEQVYRLEAAHLQFLRLWPEHFERRIAGGFVRDGHGDLRAEHICLTDPPAIFDCVEFNDRFRHNDIVDELAFLAMDLEFHGAGELADHLLRRYTERTGDDPGPELWGFYRSYRACVRSKVAALTAAGQPEPRRHTLMQAATRYLQLANYHALAFYRPRLLAVCGVMGSGKSTLATALAKDLGLQLLQSDRIRKELAGSGRGAAFGAGPYTEEVDRQVYDELIRRAETLLGHGASVLLDATFKRRRDREAVRGLARRAGVDMLFIKCVCPPATALARLDRRFRSGRGLSDGRPELYEEQARQFEPTDELAAGELLVVDTQQAVPDLVEQAIRLLAARPNPARDS